MPRVADTYDNFLRHEQQVLDGTFSLEEENDHYKKLCRLTKFQVQRLLRYLRPRFQTCFPAPICKLMAVCLWQVDRGSNSSRRHVVASCNSCEKAPAYHSSVAGNGEQLHYAWCSLGSGQLDHFTYPAFHGEGLIRSNSQKVHHLPH